MIFAIGTTEHRVDVDIGDLLLLHLLIARGLYLRALVRVKPLPLLVSVAHMLKLALPLIGTRACLSVVGAFKHMLLVTVLSLFAIAEQCERAADGRGRGDGHMSVAACILGAVAGHEVSARGDTVIRRLVGEIAQVTLTAGASEEKRLADGDCGRVVGEVACSAKGTCT